MVRFSAPVPVHREAQAPHEPGDAPSSSRSRSVTSSCAAPLAAWLPTWGPWCERVEDPDRGRCWTVGRLLPSAEAACEAERALERGASSSPRSRAAGNDVSGLVTARARPFELEGAAAPATNDEGRDDVPSATWRLAAEAAEVADVGAPAVTAASA